VLNLTDVERRILINQSRILAALYPLEASKFERTILVLSEGYHEAWEEIILAGLRLPYEKEEMNFVYRILEMFDWLQKSYYALSLDDKSQIKESALVFPGFCPRMEGPQLAYARFLMGNLERFAFLEIVNDLTTARPMRGVYERMLKRTSRYNADMLSPTQLRGVILDLNAPDPDRVRHNEYVQEPPPL
jgi:uncharacterized protein YfbU (UPF0304 family)